MEPADDLLTTLVHAGVGGDRLTEAEFVKLFVLLLSAGNLSIGASYANTQISLLRNPGQRDLVLDDMRLVPRAVEEALRMNPVVSCSARTATLDVELRGRQIAQGDRLLLWYLSGNRDDTVFRSPDEFDMTRKELDHHLAFGVGGPQTCVGAWLARLELNTLVEETLRRFPRMRLITDPVRVPSLFVNRPASVPVSLR
ncbi:cytochrome P450 [Paraconexibacter antarcticus]|uniref:Cytochrome P450 n=1 Tax=Paraconexibacter antarcticus TaxID=2949664 RepID=A0ABY5DZ50_9ACTN|nr:cytochrome P450 [Paraconexibacter antarcticus]UTI66152.1 cytochrome P450 [Paraconexibacter antarcticus]